MAWNPKSLTSTFGNWNPYKYYGGDSVNCVDETGHFAVTTGLLVVGGVNAIAMGSAWVATKVAMWAGNTNTSKMSSQLNNGILLGVGAGFAPAVIVGGGQLMMGAGIMGYQAMDVAAKTAYMTSPVWFNHGVNFLSGIGDPSAPSNVGEVAGWTTDNWDNITSKFDTTYESFSNFSFGSNSYQDDGFRFYEQSPSGDPYSFGTWEF